MHVCVYSTCVWVRDWVGWGGDGWCGLDVLILYVKYIVQHFMFEKFDINND